MTLVCQPMISSVDLHFKCLGCGHKQFIAAADAEP